MPPPMVPDPTTPTVPIVSLASIVPLTALDIGERAFRGTPAPLRDGLRSARPHFAAWPHTPALLAGYCPRHGTSPAWSGRKPSSAHPPAVAPTLWQSPSVGQRELPGSPTPTAEPYQLLPCPPSPPSHRRAHNQSAAAATR